jgi:hypothetical protein
MDQLNSLPLITCMYTASCVKKRYAFINLLEAMMGVPVLREVMMVEENFEVK